jgi:hypothetical protein
MSSEELKEISEGIAKGVLDWSLNQIKFLVNKLKYKEVAFIQDKKTISIVRELYNSGELLFYKIILMTKKCCSF